MSLIFAVAALAAVFGLLLALRAALRPWSRETDLTPALLVLVLGLPLLDALLRTVGLPLLFPGSGYLLAALGAALWLRRGGGQPWGRLSLVVVVGLAFLLLRGLGAAFDSFGENIFSLRYVQSLRLAVVYPAPDLWEASPTVNTYYTALHNLAALLSRLFLVPVPFAISLSIALVLLCLWTALYEALRSRGGIPFAGIGATATVTAGSGVSLLLPAAHLAADSRMLGYPHVRLFGMSPEEFGRPLLARLAETNPDLPLELPLHPAIYLGDLHPPLWSFVMMAALVYAWSQRDRTGGLSALAVLLGLLPWLAWAGNPWVLPHVGLLVLGLMLGDPALRQHWRLTVGAGVVAGLLLSPLILAGDYRGDLVKLAWLPAVGRATPLAWLIIWAPLLALSVAALVRRERLAWVLGGVLLLALSMEVVLFSQGDTQSPWARFNGTLKVWSLLYFLGLGLGFLALAGARGRQRWLWLLAVPAVAAAGIHSHDVVRVQLSKPERSFDWSGAHRLNSREDRAMNLMRLAALPAGRTMERLGRSAYELAPLTSMLAGQRTVSGWAHHAAQASGDGVREQQRYERIRAWYAQVGDDPLQLPREWELDYILLDWDAGWQPAHLQQMQAALAPDYFFLAGRAAGDGRASGLFIRHDRKTELR